MTYSTDIAQAEQLIRARNGASLSTVVDYLGPYLADPRKWTREQIVDFSNDGLYALAFAGMGLNRPALVTLFRKLERSDGAWLSLVDLIVEGARRHIADALALIDEKLVCEPERRSG